MTLRLRKKSSIFFITLIAVLLLLASSFSGYISAVETTTISSNQFSKKTSQLLTEAVSDELTGLESSAVEEFQPSLEFGGASFYGVGDGFHGKRTASGSKFDTYEFTAAHKELPFGSVVLVTNLLTEKKVFVSITDRGPFIKGRIIDLSFSAARELGISTGNVRLEYVVPQNTAEQRVGITDDGRWFRVSKDLLEELALFANPQDAVKSLYSNSNKETGRLVTIEWTGEKVGRLPSLLCRVERFKERETKGTLTESDILE